MRYQLIYFYFCLTNRYNFINKIKIPEAGTPVGLPKQLRLFDLNKMKNMYQPLPAVVEYAGI